MTSHKGVDIDGLKQRFLEAFKVNKTKIVHTCRDVGIGSSEFYRWMNSDKDFAQKIIDLDQEYMEKIEDVAYRQAEEEEDKGMVRYVLNKRHNRFKEGKGPVVHNNQLLGMQSIGVNDLLLSTGMNEEKSKRKELGIRDDEGYKGVKIEEEKSEPESEEASFTEVKNQKKSAILKGPKP